MGLPLAALALPALGAGMGALAGGKEGGLPGALTGGLLGAVTPAGLRLAGTRLAMVPGLGSALTKGLTAARGAVGLSGPIQAPTKLLAAVPGAVVGTGMTLGLPSLLGSIAGKGTASLGGAGQTALGTVAYPRPGEVDYSTAGLPAGTDQYGNIAPYGSPTDILAGGGLAQRLQYLKDVEAARDAMRLLNPEIFKASEARSKTEFQRQMAAAGIRQNIATRAQMLQNAQLAGLGMGATAAQQAGGALTSQYQYQ